MFYMAETNFFSGFNLQAKLTITLNEGLETIGAGAFWDYDENKIITSVNLPESVVNLGDSAFYNCAGLTRETIDLSQFETIGTHVFYRVPTITTVIAGEGTTVIPESSFYGCTGITNLDLGAVEIIGANAFEDCTGLTSVYLPDSLREMPSEGRGYYYANTVGYYTAYPFQGCTGVTSFSFGGLESLERGMIPIYQDMDIEIRSSVKSIADYMFYMAETNFFSGFNLQAKLTITLNDVIPVHPWKG